MALPSAGYSGRPLHDKLGYKPGMSVAFIGLPEQLSRLSDIVSFDDVELASQWADLVGEKQRFDIVHAFTTSRAELETNLARLQSAIRRDGAIWVSWPKKASGHKTDVTEDVVRVAALELDLVDVKVAAIDEVWSGLKLVIRKDRR